MGYALRKTLHPLHHTARYILSEMLGAGLGGLDMSRGSESAREGVSPIPLGDRALAGILERPSGDENGREVFGHVPRARVLDGGFQGPGDSGARRRRQNVD
jgi:hypothetical protein